MNAVGARIPGDYDELDAHCASENDDELEAGENEGEDDTATCIVRIQKTCTCCIDFFVPISLEKPLK